MVQQRLKIWTCCGSQSRAPKNLRKPRRFFPIATHTRREHRRLAARKPERLNFALVVRPGTIHSKPLVNGLSLAEATNNYLRE